MLGASDTDGSFGHMAVGQPHHFENPSFIPLKIPFKRFETWPEGFSGAKAVLFGCRKGATR